MEENINTETMMPESNPEQTAVDINDAISWEENVQEMAEALSNDPDFQKLNEKLNEQEADLMKFLEAYRKAKKKCERKAVSKKEKKKKKAKRRMAKQSKR